MSEATNRATIDGLVAAINGRDLAALDRVFTEDIVMEWPHRYASAARSGP